MLISCPLPSCLLVGQPLTVGGYRRLVFSGGYSIREGSKRALAARIEALRYQYPLEVFAFTNASVRSSGETDHGSAKGKSGDIARRSGVPPSAGTWYMLLCVSSPSRNEPEDDPVADATPTPARRRRWRGTSAAGGSRPPDRRSRCQWGDRCGGRCRSRERPSCRPVRSEPWCSRRLEPGAASPVRSG